MRIPGPFPIPAASKLVTPVEEPCSIMAAVPIVGEKWTLLVLREALSGMMRSDKFLRHAGCSPAILSSRLKTPMTYDILRRVPYQKPDDRVRDVYRLARTGADLLPAIVAPMQWGDRYLTPDDEGPMLLCDRESGTLIHVALVNALGEPAASENSMCERNPCYGWGENRTATAADMPPVSG